MAADNRRQEMVINLQMGLAHSTYGQPSASCCLHHLRQVVVVLLLLAVAHCAL
jgi:hypothetical protein